MGQLFSFSFEQQCIIAKQRNSANVATISFWAPSTLGAISYIMHYFSTHGCPGGLLLLRSSLHCCSGTSTCKWNIILSNLMIMWQAKSVTSLSSLPQSTPISCNCLMPQFAHWATATYLFWKCLNKVKWSHLAKTERQAQHFAEVSLYPNS